LTRNSEINACLWLTRRPRAIQRENQKRPTDVCEEWEEAVTRAVFAFCAVLLCGHSAWAEDVSFRGKTIKMVVGFASGGGTDAAGRFVAAFLGKHLPGQPTIVVQNIAGADGMTAMNFMTQQANSDGLTITMASGSQADPFHYRKPQSHFDPTKFEVIGGTGLGGTALIISKKAEPRLYDKNAPPVVMGSLSGIPRSGMQMTAWGREFLGWNSKWVVGYRGTNDLMVALERGEIDMTATGSIPITQRLLASGDFKILAQSGTLQDGKMGGRPEFKDAPVITKQMEGKIKNPVEAMSFEYWSTLSAMDKWLALPPDTPEPIVATYRQAFKAMIEDPEFIERTKNSTEFTPTSAEDITDWLKTLGKITPEAINYIGVMLNHQGITAE
jgi:tripartite-type tricarboxylate transporter receptor subunit TctC